MEKRKSSFYGKAYFRNKEGLQTAKDRLALIDKACPYTIEFNRIKVWQSGVMPAYFPVLIMVPLPLHVGQTTRVFPEPLHVGHVS